MSEPPKAKSAALENALRAFGATASWNARAIEGGTRRRPISDAIRELRGAG